MAAFSDSRQLAELLVPIEISFLLIYRSIRHTPLEGHKIMYVLALPFIACLHAIVVTFMSALRNNALRLIVPIVSRIDFNHIR